MRRLPLRLPLIVALSVLAVGSAFVTRAATPAPQQKQQPPPQKPAAKPATTATVPADVRARVVAKLPGAKAEDVGPSPIPGIYEVTMGGLIAYVTADGKYLLSGNLYDLDTQQNLTSMRFANAAKKALAQMSESQMIVFGPQNAKMTVTVFTDIDCGWCRKFHTHIAELNKAGVRVRYLFFPRSGPGTESWKKAEQVWCATDRRDALTRAKRGEPVNSRGCGDAVVRAQYELGTELGVDGTPSVFTQWGDKIGGYLAPEDLVQAVRESQQAAAAAAATAAR
jgi:thiol:disulfide interchange protein DsbC